MTNRTDNFNRADTTTNIGTPSDGGSAWVQLSGTWGISNNRAYKPANESVFEVAYLESSVSNVEVQVTLSFRGNIQGIAFRIVDNSNYLFARLFDAASTVNFYTMIGGSPTSIASASTTLADGDVWKVRATATNDFTLFQNGISVLTANNSNFSTATKHGLMGYSAATESFDDFSITEIVPLGFGKISSNRKFFLPSEAAILLAALESKRRLSRRRFFQWLPGAFWRK